MERIIGVSGVLLLGSAACNPTADSGVQVGGEGKAMDCGTVVTEVGLSDPTVDGRTGEEALALLGSAIDGGPAWFDGRIEALTLTVTSVDSTVTAYTNTNSDCVAGWIELDARMTLSSDGGSLSESWDGLLRWEEPFNELRMGGRVPVADIVGTLDWRALSANGQSLEIYVVQGVAADAGFVELLTTPSGTAATVDTASMFSRLPVVSWGALR